MRFNMFKTLIVPVLIAVTLMISSCSSNNNQPGTGGPLFIGGVEGLTFQFVEGMPPSEIFDAGQFPFHVSLQIANEGEHDYAANTGYVRIKGFSPQQLGLGSVEDMKKLIDRDLHGKKRIGDEVFPGDTMQLSFENLVYTPDIPSGTQTITFYIESCYKYGNKAFATLCLRGNNFQPGVQEVCQVTGSKAVDNSAGPVQVVSLTESPIGQSDVQITLKIKNVGKGVVFSKDFPLQEQNCEDIPGNMLEKNKVYVALSLDGGEEIECPQLDQGSEGFIRLLPAQGGDEGSLYCVIHAPEGEGTFKEFLKINMTYAYKQEISKDVTVRDISGYNNN